MAMPVAHSLQSWNNIFAKRQSPGHKGGKSLAKNKFCLRNFDVFICCIYNYIRFLCWRADCEFLVLI